MSKLLDLTPKQEEKFKKLEKAYKECEKAGIVFENILGDLYAYSKSKIKKIDIPEDSNNYNDGDTVALVDVGYGINYFNSECSWADDGCLHHFILTDYGKKIAKKEGLI